MTKASRTGNPGFRNTGVVVVESAGRHKSNSTRLNFISMYFELDASYPEMRSLFRLSKAIAYFSPVLSDI